MVAALAANWSLTAKRASTLRSLLPVNLRANHARICPWELHDMAAVSLLSCKT